MHIKKKSIAFVILIIASVGFILFRILEKEELENSFKFLFVVSTLVYYLLSTKKTEYLYVFSLFMFLIADSVFYINEVSGNIMFLGLVAYFVATVSIILLVINEVYIGFEGKKSLKYITVLLALQLVVYFLSKDFGSIKIVLLFYAISYSLLFSLSLYYYFKKQNKASVWLLYGSAFLAGCNIFAMLNKFDAPNIYYTVISGIGYVLALFFITKFVVLSNHIQ